jgi:hypothetical protein
MTAIKVDVGRPRSPNDGSRRFLPDAVSFDARPTLLATVIEDDWEPHIKAQWATNQANVREWLIHEFGAASYEQKIQNFIELGTAPWSVVALHNVYLKQVRDAFVAMHYYPALLGACGLGERILNQLVLTLRDDYKENPATRHVANKKALDDWKRCVRTLQAWGVFDDETARDYLSLMAMRHAAVHYRSELDSGDAREAALEAVTQLCRLVERIFLPMGNSPHYFSGPIGRSYVRLEAEAKPFVRHFILPACVLVSPVFRFVSNGATLDVYDDPDYGVGQPDLSDAEFADPARATPQVPYPF